MSESVCSKKLGNIYLKNQLREFHPVLVTDVLGSTDVLLGLLVKRSKIKDTAGNDLGHHHISKTNKAFIDIRLRPVLPRH